MSDNNFRYQFLSDVEFENLTVEILFKDETVAQINQDKGRDRLEVQFFNSQKMDLNSLISEINKATKDLLNE